MYKSTLPGISTHIAHNNPAKCSAFNKVFKRGYATYNYVKLTIPNEVQVHSPHIIHNEGEVAPYAPLPKKEVLDKFVDFWRNNKGIAVITGAGCSTESGIPDYRSPKGSFSKGHKPTTYQEFINSHHVRQRYWARSMSGWKSFWGVKPNATHHVLSSLEKSNYVTGIITQNVDRLHSMAGSENVIELHGNNAFLVCMSCKSEFSRPEFQLELEAINQDWIKKYEINLNGQDIENIKTTQVRADGDLDLRGVDYSTFHVPSCKICKSKGIDGVLKPCVVFFGENAVPSVVQNATNIVKNSRGLVAIGTSLMVYSSFRFMKMAEDGSIPVWILNVGPTRADNLKNIQGKIESRSSDVLNVLKDQLHLK
eukprot:TRINITY_DN1171_c0_g1_i2.p1 TRINITY_DN1171_c0_g1~~TRINITY_DN1171_c0_g1_i2.p1  ORF type:complete len:366 (-),score=66.83 TRINITY_DN1171_c0_g1_i2:59-1156(-)